MERLSSGGRQLVQGVRQLVEQPRPAAGPFYPPPPTTHLPHQPPQPLQGNLPTPTYTQPPASSPGSWQPPQPSPPSPQPPQQLLEDEALAAALQRQFDLEEAQQQQQQQLQRLPPPQQQQQQQPQQPQWPPAAGGPLGAGLPSLPSAGRPSPSAGPQPPRGAAVVAAPPRPPTLAVDSSRCAGCGVSLVSMFGRQPYITALGRCWHPACFRCASCGGPIGGGSGVRFLERQGHAFHAACHKERFHPRCAICGDFVPEQVGACTKREGRKERCTSCRPTAQPPVNHCTTPCAALHRRPQANRRIVWSENRFWKQRYCPSHDTDGTPRCTGCSRLQPAGEQWAELEDGRQLCLECLETASLDTRDAQPLWQSVLRCAVVDGLGRGLCLHLCLTRWVNLMAHQPPSLLMHSRIHTNPPAPHHPAASILAWSWACLSPRP